MTSSLVPMLAIGQTLFFVACALMGLGIVGWWITQWYIRRIKRDKDPLQ